MTPQTDGEWVSRQARGTEHLLWMLGQTSTPDFWSSGCVMFYLETGRQEFPWKDSARKQGHCSVGWKTTKIKKDGKQSKQEENTTWGY